MMKKYFLLLSCLSMLLPLSLTSQSKAKLDRTFAHIKQSRLLLQRTCTSEAFRQDINWAQRQSEARLLYELQQEIRSIKQQMKAIDQLPKQDFVDAFAFLHQGMLILFEEDQYPKTMTNTQHWARQQTRNVLKKQIRLDIQRLQDHPLFTRLVVTQVRNEVVDAYVLMVSGIEVLEGRKVDPSFQDRTYRLAEAHPPALLQQEMLHLMLIAYHRLYQPSPISKRQLDLAFAHFKQAQLLLNHRSGPQHSIGSHHGWATYQSPAQVTRAFSNQLEKIRISQALQIR